MAMRGFDREKFFQALGDETRLRLLNLMGEQEICVCYFTGVLGVAQPKISRHLAYLRGAGLVEARRDGKWMHYRISAEMPEEALEIVGRALAWVAADKAMMADRARLTKACCSPGKFVGIVGAPKPVTTVTSGK